MDACEMLLRDLILGGPLLYGGGNFRVLTVVPGRDSEDGIRAEEASTEFTLAGVIRGTVTQSGSSVGVNGFDFRFGFGIAPF